MDQSYDYDRYWAFDYDGNPDDLVGTKAILHKPHNTGESPVWIESFDNLNGKVVTIERIRSWYDDYRSIDIEEIHGAFNILWLEQIGHTKPTEITLEKKDISDFNSYIEEFL